MMYTMPVTGEGLPKHCVPDGWRRASFQRTVPNSLYAACTCFPAWKKYRAGAPRKWIGNHRIPRLRSSAAEFERLYAALIGDRFFSVRP